MSNIPQAIQELELPSTDSFLEYNDIKAVLLANLKTNPNYVNIVNSFSGSGTLELIIHLISLSHDISSFMNLRGVQESYLEFAQLDNSIFSRAAELGYRINRPTAPTYVFQYTAIPTITLIVGTVLGTYNNYNLVYFGPTVIIEQGDQVIVQVGQFQEKTFTFDTTNTNPIVNSITPSLLNAIDNNNIQIVYNNLVMSKTIFPEDYIVFEKYADFSSSTTSTNILVADFGLMHGLAMTFLNSIAVGASDSYTIQYMETDINIPSIDINTVSVVSGWEGVNQGSLGVLGDTTSSIVKNAPLLYSLLRRAVTENDFVFLLNSLPQFKSTSIGQYGGSPGVWQIQLDNSVTNYVITINSINYAYQNIAILPLDTVTTILYKQLLNDTNTTPELVTISGSLAINLYSKSSRLPLDISCSTGCTLTNTTAQVQTKPCVFVVSYVGYNTVNNVPVPLTQSDYNNVSTIINYYKGMGITLYYQHAIPVSISLNYTISLKNSSDQALVLSLINQVITSFNLRVEVLIDSASILKTIGIYCNKRFGIDLINYTIDSTPVSKFITKLQYSVITNNVVFI